MINFSVNKNLVKVALFCFFSWIVIAVNAQSTPDTKTKQKPVSALAEGLKKLEKEASAGKASAKNRSEAEPSVPAANVITDGTNKSDASSGLVEGLKKLAKEIEKVDKHKVANDNEAATRSARIAESLATINLIKNEQAAKKETSVATSAVLAAETKVDGALVNTAVANTIVVNPNSSAPSAVTSVPAVLGSEQRLALVIGNSTYKTSPLINPANDARAMAIKLQQLGFTVIKKENADREEMMSAVRDFGNQLKNGGVGLFYYAGHGIQSKGVNYLVPVDSNINSEDELSTRAYNANEVLEKMDSAKNRINMVILDACRDNPFARSFRSGSRGLASVDTPSGTLIAYATAPGSTASDGSGANGLYTEQLLTAMSEPGLKMEEVFKHVRANVMERSGGKQNPWEMSSVIGDFYFNPTSQQIAAGASLASVAVRQPEMSRQLLPVLIPRKLIENFQLAGAFNLNAAPTVGAFSNDSQFLSLATKDKVLSMWDGQNASPLGNEIGMSGLSLGRQYLLALSDSGRVSVTDLNGTVSSQKNFTNLPDGVSIAAISPNGKRLLIFTRANGFVLYDMNTQQMIAKLDEYIEGQAKFKFSPAGDRLLTWGGAGSRMVLWDTDRGVKLSRLTDHWRSPGLVQFTSDGNLLVSAALDDRVILWRLSDGDSIKKFSFGEGNPVPLRMDFLNDHRRLLAYVQRSAERSAPSYLQLGVWDTTSGSMLASLLPEGATANSYKISPDGTRLFINANDKNVYVIDLGSLTRVNTMIGVQLLDFSADGRRFLLLGNEGIRLMDSSTLSSLNRMPGQLNAFLPQNKSTTFATGAADGTLTLWNLDSGDPVGQLKGHIDPVMMMVFSEDGRKFLSVGSDNAAKLWGLPEVKDVAQLAKDTFESTAEYQKRVGTWSSPYTSLVSLVSFNADTEIFTVKFGEISVGIPMGRDAAKKLLGQRQAIVSGTLKFFDIDQLVLNDSKLNRLQ